MAFMRVAYLDCFSGISGDMFLGALVDAGVPHSILEQAVASLQLGARLEFSRASRSGISATKVDVIVDGMKELPRELSASASHHLHTHTDRQEHGHKASGQAHGRSLSAIRKIIGKAQLSESARKIAIAIFEKLGAAEAKIHNLPIDQIHFHEVGAVDALVDIVCASVGAETLAVDEFFCSPLNVGGGTVTCAHGTFPVPVPATVELLKGAPVYSSGIQAELVTPTGAAIVATLTKHFAEFPQMTIAQTGYGAGTRDIPGHPNVLRITVGESLLEGHPDPASTRASHETISVLEANFDDLNPQVFGYLLDRLLEAGALDVFTTAVQMKKNRPGILLSVLAKPEKADELTQIIFAESTTLGVRRREEQRQILPRKWHSVSTRFGDVRIKLASLNGTVTSYAPEYEDCRRIAAEHRVPLKIIMQEAVQEFLKSGKR
jgi:pyridinium-3,5-bisthiocarboxylic acid mononucleotide nickel chelatase